MKLQLLAASCCATFVVTAAFAAPPHVHGVAALDVSLEGETLELHLDSPLQNLAGFEHKPASPAEVDAIRAMVRRFEHPESLFAPSPAARCTVKWARLSSTALEASQLSLGALSAAAPKTPPAAEKEEAGHADLDAEISMHCDRPQALKRIEAKLFAAFPGLHQIDAQVVTPGRQFAAKLTAADPAISF